MAVDTDFVMKVGATQPTLDATLAGGPLHTRDLTGATVTLRLRSMGTVVPQVLPAVVVNAALMMVRYAWPTPQALAPGVYEGEWYVSWSDGVIAIYPDNGYFLLKIVAALA
jgi:hypothetical protein